MLLAGVGFLLPYNSFITDVDYLHHKFQGINMHEPSHAPKEIAGIVHAHLQSARIFMLGVTVDSKM